MGLIENLEATITKLQNDILLIDESNYIFRSNIESWSFYLKNGVQRENKYMPNASIMARNSVLNQNEDDLKDFFLNKKSKSKGTSSFSPFEMKTDYSPENKRNLLLSLIHILLYMFNFAIIVPSFFLYIEHITDNAENGILSGCILGISLLFTLFNEKYLYKLFNSYKRLLVLSLIMMLLGNAFYIFAFYFKSIYFIMISQLFIGFGNFKMMNRKYLIQYSPRFLYNQYSYYYLIFNSLGLILGK